MAATGVYVAVRTRPTTNWDEEGLHVDESRNVSTFGHAHNAVYSQ